MKNITKSSYFRFAVSAGLLLAPALVFGATKDFKELAEKIILPLLNIAITIIFTLGIVMFIWGVVQYVINQADSAEREKGRSFMIWGIIALFVMVSVYGLVRLVGNTFDLDNDQVLIPQITTTP